MTGVLLEGQIDCTVDHNDIVPLLLGLSKILDEVSERVGAGADRRRRGRGTVEPVDEDLVLACVGSSQRSPNASSVAPSMPIGPLTA